MRSAMASMALATTSACEATAGTTLASSAFIKWTKFDGRELVEVGRVRIARFGLEMVH